MERKEKKQFKQKKMSEESFLKEENISLHSKKKFAKKDWNKILLIVLSCLLGIEIILIPCLIYAEVKKILPIIFFLILPTIFGIFVVLLSSNCSNDYQHKKERLVKKI